MRRDAGNMDFPAAKVDEKQDVICHQPAQGPHFRGEKIGRHKDVHVRADELLPGRGGLALWRWEEAMAFQDVAHGLVTDGIPEVGQSSDDPVVAPRAILLRDAHHQGFQLLVNLRPPHRLTLLRAITLLGDQCAVPAENRRVI
jgi:hypothetical protein